MQANGSGGWGVEPSTRVGGSRRAQSGSLGWVASLVQRFYLSGFQFVGEVALGKGLAFSRGCGEVDPFLGGQTAVKEGGRTFRRVQDEVLVYRLAQVPSRRRTGAECRRGVCRCAAMTEASCGCAEAGLLSGKLMQGHAEN